MHPDGTTPARPAFPGLDPRDPHPTPILPHHQLSAAALADHVSFYQHAAGGHHYPQPLPYGPPPPPGWANRDLWAALDDNDRAWLLISRRAARNRSLLVAAGAGLVLAAVTAAVVRRRGR
jgi:hypothetical protein